MEGTMVRQGGKKTKQRWRVTREVSLKLACGRRHVSRREAVTLGCSGSGLHLRKAFQGRPAEGEILPWNDLVGLPHPLTMDGGAGPTHQVAHPP